MVGNRDQLSNRWAVPIMIMMGIFITYFDCFSEAEGCSYNWQKRADGCYGINIHCLITWT